MNAARTVLIAGEGALPGVLAAALGRSGTAWYACHLDGHPPAQVGQSRAFRIERLGGLLDELRADGVARVCFAGRVARPRIDPTQIDAATQLLVPRIAAALEAGDDGALRAVIEIFEDAGFDVVGADAIAPELLDVPVVGQPSDRDRRDIARARAVHAALGAADVGQGCCVAGGQVLAVEALPGTDWMLASLAPPPPAAPQPMAAAGGGLLGGMADWLSGPAMPARGLPDFARPPGGVLYKAPKPTQDRRIDLPTIGPETVRRAAAAGLAGIAIEAGGVLVLEAADVAAQARAGDVFLTTVER